MVAIENVRNFLLDSKYYIPYLTKVLANEKDTFMQEFSSSILAELSKDMFGAAHLLKQCPDMNFLFDRLLSPDPDVKKNTIQIMYNLLQDPSGAQKIVEAEVHGVENIIEILHDFDYTLKRPAICRTFNWRPYTISSRHLIQRYRSSRWTWCPSLSDETRTIICRTSSGDRTVLRVC